MPPHRCLRHGGRLRFDSQPRKRSRHHGGPSRWPRHGQEVQPAWAGRRGARRRNRRLDSGRASSPATASHPRPRFLHWPLDEAACSRQARISDRGRASASRSRLAAGQESVAGFAVEESPMSRLERIVAACGGILLDNGKRALIPGPDHSRKDRSVSLVETEDGRILIHCFSPQDDWRAVRARWRRKDCSMMRCRYAGLRGRQRRLHWSRRSPSRKSALRARAGSGRKATPSASRRRNAICATAPFRRNLWNSPALRFHPRMTSLDDRQRRPALIAAITDAGGERARRSGDAAERARRSESGGPDAPPCHWQAHGRRGAPGCGRTDQLAIGEGVETMLSASQALGLPAWAALTADNLALFSTAGALSRLVIAVDNDAAGYAAYEKLKARLAIAVEMARPPTRRRRLECRSVHASLTAITHRRMRAMLTVDCVSRPALFLPPAPQASPTPSPCPPGRRRRQGENRLPAPLTRASVRALRARTRAPPFSPCPRRLMAGRL